MLCLRKAIADFSSKSCKNVLFRKNIIFFVTNSTRECLLHKFWNHRKFGIEAPLLLADLESWSRMITRITRVIEICLLSAHQRERFSCFLWNVSGRIFNIPLLTRTMLNSRFIRFVLWSSLLIGFPCRVSLKYHADISKPLAVLRNYHKKCMYIHLTVDILYLYSGDLFRVWIRCRCALFRVFRCYALAEPSGSRDTAIPAPGKVA